MVVTAVTVVVIALLLLCGTSFRELFVFVVSNLPRGTCTSTSTVDLRVPALERSLLGRLFMLPNIHFPIR